MSPPVSSFFHELSCRNYMGQALSTLDGENLIVVFLSTELILRAAERPNLDVFSSCL
jgi:hypothetical protein